MHKLKVWKTSFINCSSRNDQNSKISIPKWNLAHNLRKLVIRKPWIFYDHSDLNGKWECLAIGLPNVEEKLLFPLNFYCMNFMLVNCVATLDKFWPLTFEFPVRTTNKACVEQSEELEHNKLWAAVVSGHFFIHGSCKSISNWLLPLHIWATDVIFGISLPIKLFDLLFFQERSENYLRQISNWRLENFPENPTKTSPEFSKNNYKIF